MGSQIDTNCSSWSWRPRQWLFWPIRQRIGDRGLHVHRRRVSARGVKFVCVQGLGDVRKKFDNDLFIDRAQADPLPLTD